MLVRIYYAFTNPRFEFFVDPWTCIQSGQLKFIDYGMATLKGETQQRDSAFLMSQGSLLRMYQLGLIPGNKSTPSRTGRYYPLSPNPKHRWVTTDSEPTSTKPIISSDELDFSKKTMAVEQAARAHKQNLPVYQYKTLKERDIRLFVLFPGEYSDPLRGLVCHMLFEDAGPYRALSYVWGPEDQPVRDLVTTQGTLKIKASLGAALQQIRQKTEVLVLWVDAICINQQDNHEKIEQISLLPQIYQQAICTLAIIATDRKSDEALQTLLDITALHCYGSDASTWPPGYSYPRASWVEDGIPAPDDPIWLEVSNLFRRPWFRRSWIIQEAIAAPTVKFVCGGWIFDWNDLHCAMELVERRNDMPLLEESWRPFMTLTEHREWEATGQRWPLLRLLETFQYTKASLQRDRLFSLLGLAVDGDDPLFQPDYESPFEEIVRRYAQAFVETGWGMNLLYRAGLTDNDLSDNPSSQRRFPSWVPDWTAERSNRDPLSSATGRGVSFTASQQTESDMSYSEQGDELLVYGIICDNIVSVSRFSNQPSHRSRYFQELDMMIESCDSLGGHDHKQKLKETVPVAGALYPEIGQSTTVSITEAYSAFRKILRKEDMRAKGLRWNGKKGKTRKPPHVNNPSPKKQPEIRSDRDKSKTYEALLDTYIKGWKFVLTKGGRCGIAPDVVLPGDKVTILCGGRVPFLLRQQQGPDGNKNLLVGECYIDGLMFGEGLKHDPRLKMLHIV